MHFPAYEYKSNIVFVSVRCVIKYKIISSLSVIVLINVVIKSYKPLNVVLSCNVLIHCVIKLNNFLT